MKCRLNCSISPVIKNGKEKAPTFKEAAARFLSLKRGVPCFLLSSPLDTREANYERAKKMPPPVQKQENHFLLGKWLCHIAKLNQLNTVYVN